MKDLFKRFFVVSLFFLTFSNEGMATCRIISSVYTANDTGNFNFGNILIDRNTPIGAVVASSTNTDLGGRGYFVTCFDSLFTTQWALGSAAYSPVSYGGETLYSSGVGGLAYRIITPGANSTGGSTLGKYGTVALPRSVGSIACNSNGSSYNLCGATWGNPTVELVKIAETTGSGDLTTGSILQALIVGESNIMTYMITAGSVQTNLMCSVVNSNIVVNLGKVNKSEFSGLHSTSSVQTPFSIVLNCDPSTNVTVTVDPGSSGSPNQGRGALFLDSVAEGDKASGVAVQVLYNGSNIRLGSPISIGNAGAGGIYTIDMAARYIQTASTTTAITVGQANANATFTMTYQ